MPEWELGIGRTLNNLNWTDLFGNRKMHNYVQLTNRLHQLMGSQAHTPETVQAALENLSEADRTERLSQETKAMLLDPQRRIALSDLVQNETSRLLALLSDPNPTAPSLRGKTDWYMPPRRSSGSPGPHSPSAPR
ncbi:hypothetical protein GY12_21810 [Micrococcus luteus]|nr:hypothetical protein GY12_21810 [Micrococcus luteus]